MPILTVKADFRSSPCHYSPILSAILYTCVLEYSEVRLGDTFRKRHTQMDRDHVKPPHVTAQPSVRAWLTSGKPAESAASAAAARRAPPSSSQPRCSTASVAAGGPGSSLGFGSGSLGKRSRARPRAVSSIAPPAACQAARTVCSLAAAARSVPAQKRDPSGDLREAKSMQRSPKRGPWPNRPPTRYSC